MRHPDYPFWNFIGLMAVLLPLPYHWRARNIGILALIFWVGLGDFLLFLNTLIWADKYGDYSPVWCDISSRVIAIIPYAIPACTLAQMHKLEQVASARRSVVSGSERNRRMWGELALCVVFPLVTVPITYLVQGHRYDLLESEGCFVHVVLNWSGVTVRFLVPMLLSVASLVYAGLAVRLFVVRRLQFRSLLASSSSGLTISRYLRLIALAMTEVTILLFSDTLLIIAAFGGGDPIVSDNGWGSVHHDFSLISQYGEEDRNSLTMGAEVFSLYSLPLYSITIFIFFGLGEEAVAMYTAVGERFVALLFRLNLTSAKPATSAGNTQLPTLGSKVVSAGGPDWSIGQDSSRLEEGHKEDHLFFAGDCTDSRGGQGIPVLVERSVV